jgi:anti-sigma factor RsiW
LQFSHETDEQLERYALGSLPEPQVAVVEEHLLVCVTCQERLDDLGTFALAMRDAIASEPAVQARTGWFEWLRSWDPRQPALAWAGGFAILVLASGLYLHSGRIAGRDALPLASLELTAMRGDIQSAALARETDITLADAPPGPALRAEVVDATGGRVWSGALDGDGHKIKLMKQLAPGDYFVRLHDNTDRLLHEYGFRVRRVL